MFISLIVFFIFIKIYLFNGCNKNIWVKKYLNKFIIIRKKKIYNIRRTYFLIF